MTERQIELVQSSFTKVDAISDTAAGIFYGKLFELKPEFEETLFRNTDVKEQGKKLMNMLKIAVLGLSDLSKLVPAVEQLGIRHAGYGVKDDHYNTVAEALIYTLGVGLGDDFTDEVKEAWVTCYILLADTMKAAANKAAA